MLIIWLQLKNIILSVYGETMQIFTLNRLPSFSMLQFVEVSALLICLQIEDPFFFSLTCYSRLHFQLNLQQSLV